MLILHFFIQDLVGSAVPAIQSDELGETLSGKSKEPEHVTLVTSPPDSNEGLNMLQKLTFLGVILGVVAMFLKSRKGPVLIEKSLA